MPVVLSCAPGESIQLIESLCDTNWMISSGHSCPGSVASRLATSTQGSAGSGVAYQWCRGLLLSQRKACTGYRVLRTSYAAAANCWPMNASASSSELRVCPGRV